MSRCGALVGTLAGLACAAIVVACSAAMHNVAAPPPVVQSGSQTPIPGDNHGQIDAWMADIDRAKRDQAAVPPSAATSCGDACERLAHDVAVADTTCHPPPTQTCTDVCKLGTSICETKDKICDLAGKMQGDAWAKGKCDDAKTSCDTAHGNCCSCR